MKFSQVTLATFLVVAVSGVEAFAPTATTTNNVAFLRSSVSQRGVVSSTSKPHTTTCTCPSCMVGGGGRVSTVACQLSTSSTTSCTCPACTMGAVSSRSSHPTNCSCGSCSSTRKHPSGCVCGACRMSSMLLRMADDEEAAAEATVADNDEVVPPEVEAVEGTVSEEEVHNKERPARGSGIKKHSKGPKGVPLSELEVGSTIKGTIKTITSYGAFMDVGAQSDALLHVSRMSDDFTSNPEDVVSVGQEVNVRIFSIDLNKNQIAVTMQSVEAETKAAEAKASGGGGRRKERPQRSGGDRAAQRVAMSLLKEKGYNEEQFVEGEVVNTLDFGAFVRVDISQLGEGLKGEVDGLVHISSLTEGRANSVTSIVNTGDKVQVRIKMVDSENGKIGLSMISKEADAKAGGGRGGGGERRERQPRNAMFRSDEMGASDWKETVTELQEKQPEFKNMPIVERKTKELA